MRTAPVPNIPAIPGMNPGVFVLGGGGGGGGGRGKGGKGGKNSQKAKGKNGGKGAGGGGKGACGNGTGDPNGGSCPKHHKGKKSGKASKGDPVDVVTGNVFTIPVLDVDLPGPLPLEIARAYYATSAERDVGLGFGWCHSLAWDIEVGRRSITVWSDQGLGLEFDALEEGEGETGPEGMVLLRGARGFVLDTGEGRWLVFEARHGERWLLTAVRDAFDNTISLVYAGGRLAEVHDSAGRVVRVRRDREGRIAAWEIKNAPEQGRWIALGRFAYDERGHLVEARDADDHATTYTYDDDHLLLTHTSPVGLTFHFRYDGERRCVETWGAYGAGADRSLSDGVPAVLADGETAAKGIYHCKFIYDGDGYSEAIDSITVHRYFGNEHGKLDKAVSAGAVVERRYDEGGNLLAYTDSLGATTQWKRDALGRVLQEIDPLGRVTTHERDADGHIRRSIDAMGGETRVERFAGGIAWTDPLGAQFESRFDARGLVVETIGPNGGRTRFGHDAHGNLVEKVDASGHVTRWAYDTWGRCTARQDPSGATFYYTYNTRGDLLSERKPDGSVVRYDYDAIGQRTSVMGENGRVTRYVYGGFRKLCEVHEADGAVTRMKYDREGRLVEVVNPKGEVHSIALNVAGMVVSERTFDGRQLHYRYDSEGRLIMAENGLGQKTWYEYDLAGQLIEQRYDDDRVERFEYDALGRIVRAEGPCGVFEYERNALGWVVREKQTVDGETVVVDIARDLVGNVVRRATSLGHAQTWDRDIMGQSTRVVLDGGEEILPVHDVLGREVARILPAGGRIDAAYDERDRLVQRRVTAARLPATGQAAWSAPSAGVTTVEQAYRYSPASELLEVRDRAAGVRRFEHDGVGRLAFAGIDGQEAERFVYDATGNLYEQALVERRYGQGNRLQQRGSKQYTWDDDARLVQARTAGRDGEQTVHYRWGANGLLEAVERPDGVCITFAYDPFARRVQKKVVRRSPGAAPAVESTTRYVWDGDVLVHEITQRPSGAGAPIVEARTYCHDDRGFPWAHQDVRVERGQRVASGYYHYLTDDIGTPERLLSSDGSVACEIRRSAWGRFEVSPGAVTTTPIGYQGQYYDEETGLFYNRHRYYDPEAGRYISADPVGLISGFNAFAYAESQPTRFVDPLGLMAKAKIWDQPGAGKKKEISGYSEGQPRPPHEPDKPRDAQGNPEYDPAVQDAVDKAKGKFSEEDPKTKKLKDPSKERLPNTAGKCAEIEALDRQAKEIRGDLQKQTGWDKLSKDEQNAKVRNELREQYRKGAKIQAYDKKGNPIPPCKFCAQVFRELGIHPDNINADPNKDTKKKGQEQPKATGGVHHNDAPWDGKKVHGTESPRTEASQTAVVPRTDGEGKHVTQKDPKTGKNQGVYYPPENPPPGGYPPGGPPGAWPEPGGGGGGGGASGGNPYYDDQGNYIGPRDKHKPRK
ncbi:RHS repeat-associated core domain-containing protein [Sorangium sp. So ce131]|uniref:RHS repeat-associated core domain-containing protein n=1 Tax=Sorangium sp. So ce131 TaxID=3133282 RepID=UPI003F5D6AFF